MSLTASEAKLRSLHFTVEPSLTMHAPGSRWDHEIRVALPVSYQHTTRHYPVLWITDNSLEAALASLGGAELILVAVGNGAEITVREDSIRRAYDFLPASDVFFEDTIAAYFRKEWSRLHPGLVEKRSTGGADRFLNFLVDDVRPALTVKYRMDPVDHGLLGFSFAGTFVAYSLFTRPGAFTRFICGSPPLYVAERAIFRLEERYARTHDDLAADVFFAAGDAEATEYLIAALGCVSSMVRLVEILSTRGYARLRTTMKIFHGESHGTMLPPLLRWGVPAVWGPEIVPAFVESAEAGASAGND